MKRVSLGPLTGREELDARLSSSASQSASMSGAAQMPAQL